MKRILLACLVLPLAGCITVHETASEPEHREVIVERVREVITTADDADASRMFVRAVRIAATDVPAIADFYSKAFGMREIRRLESPGFLEIIMNSGETKEEATANPHAPIVIMTRPEGLQVGELASVLLTVPDMEGAVASVVAAGGTVFRPTRSLPNGTVFTFVKDPEGNQVELIIVP